MPKGFQKVAKNHEKDIQKASKCKYPVAFGLPATVPWSVNALAIELAVALAIALAMSLLIELPIEFLMDLLIAFGNSIMHASAVCVPRWCLPVRYWVGPELFPTLFH